MPQRNAPIDTPTLTVHEGLAPDVHLIIHPRQECLTQQTTVQHLQIVDTASFGRLYRVDGCNMASERDAAGLHECMVHPALLCVADPRMVLIAGGGDGGSTVEALRHGPDIRVEVHEIDAAVPAATGRWLPGIQQDAFADPRVRLQIGDAALAIDRAAHAGQRFDAVIYDLTDPAEPHSPAAPLFAPQGLSAVARLLGEHGVLSLHLGSPFYQPDAVQTHLQALRIRFRVLRLALVHVPLYGGPWLLGFASNGPDPARLDPEHLARRLHARGLTRLHYLDGAAWPSLFSLPRWMRQRFAPESTCPPRCAPLSDPVSNP